MGWVHDVISVGIGGLLGILAGAWLAFRRRGNDRLFRCYVSYFDSVLSVAVETEAAAARSKFLQLSRTSRQLELLESDAGCVMSTGLLFARCNTLVTTLSEVSPSAPSEIARLREEVSEEYATTLRVVRQRLGSPRELSWRTNRPLIAARKLRVANKA